MERATVRRSAKLAEWLPYWLDHFIKPNRKRTTYNKYAIHVRLYLVPLLGSKSLEALRPRLVRALVAEVSRRATPATAKEAHRVLRTALTAACREEVVTRNAASLVEAPKVPRRELSPSSYVFTTRTGRPIDPQNINRSFFRITAAAGLRRIRLHDARHGCATLLTAAGVAPSVVMEILGHGQISITMDVYTHVTSDTQREAISHMDRLLRRRLDRE
ncbi:tyrosine-type recombinase/integrase [Streptomyces sp. NPDC047022]|uniref:tyrosine-type recombinase/integrase n=1 Tax=Streptomyces sp. NPDC047022 TaxID=3155737 RepID=UPI0033E12DE5